jgi:N-acyl homoserine lactone hydrolase
MTGVSRIVPLTFGWEDLPETISVHGGDPTRRYREPVPGVALRTSDGWLLLDTGFNVPLARDPFLNRRFHGRNHDIRCELLPDPRDSLEVAFQTAGINPDDIGTVALSHLHNDHAGGLRWFAERCPVHAQRRELAYGLSTGPDGPQEHGFFPIDYDDPRIDWRLADGDTTIAGGVRALATPGHTPGHQSFVIRLDSAATREYGAPGFVLAFDAADLQRNLDEEIAPGGLINHTPEEAVESIRRLKSIAARHGYPVIPGHDPHAWPAFTARTQIPGPP